MVARSAKVGCEIERNERVAVTSADRTYFPPDQTEEIAEVASFLSAYKEKYGEDAEPQFFLSGRDEDSHIALPRELYDILVEAVDALNSGKAVTIHPNNLTVTTQEAAEILGVSRPTVVKLVEEGMIPATKVRRHRRLMLNDVIAYRDGLRTRQLDFIAETTDDEPLPSKEELRAVRREIAQRRKG